MLTVLGPHEQAFQNEKAASESLLAQSFSIVRKQMYEMCVQYTDENRKMLEFIADKEMFQSLKYSCFVT